MEGWKGREERGKKGLRQLVKEVLTHVPGSGSVTCSRWYCSPGSATGSSNPGTQGLPVRTAGRVIAGHRALPAQALHMVKERASAKEDDIQEAAAPRGSQDEGSKDRLPSVHTTYPLSTHPSQEPSALCFIRQKSRPRLRVSL